MRERPRGALSPALLALLQMMRVRDNTLLWSYPPTRGKKYRELQRAHEKRPHFLTLQARTHMAQDIHLPPSYTMMSMARCCHA